MSQAVYKRYDVFHGTRFSCELVLTVGILWNDVFIRDFQDQCGSEYVETTQKTTFYIQVNGIYQWHSSPKWTNSDIIECCPSPTSRCAQCTFTIWRGYLFVWCNCHFRGYIVSLSTNMEIHTTVLLRSTLEDYNT